MTFEMVQWCGICNAAPSDGQLTIENPVDPSMEPMIIEACKSCVYKLDWEGGKVVHERPNVLRQED